MAAPPGARQRTIGALLVFVGTLLALSGTGLALSASFVDGAGSDKPLIGVAGIELPLQILIGGAAGLLGLLMLFFGLVLRELGSRRAAIPVDTDPAVRLVRVDPVHERHVRWGVMGALFGVFVMAIFAAVALSPDPLVVIGAGEENAAHGSPLDHDVWEGEAAASPTAHLEEHLSARAERIWTVPDGGERVFVNLSWEVVDPTTERLRVVLQEAQGDGWTVLESAEGVSPVKFNVDVEEGTRLRAVVERVQESDQTQPFLLYLSFWAS